MSSLSLLVQIARPSSSRYVRLYDSSGDNVFSFDMALDGASFPEPGSDGRNVTFTFSYDFAQLALYYVLLDEGTSVIRPGDWGWGLGVRPGDEA